MLGDLQAQIGSVRVGERRLIEICDKYGVDYIKDLVDELIDYADRLTTEEIRAMPNGEAIGVDYSDHDGDGNNDIPIKVKIKIEGDMIKADLNGNIKQVEGGCNSSFANSVSAVESYILLCISGDIPHNEGCLRHIEVTVGPEGTIVNPTPPHSTSSCTYHIGGTIFHATGKALSQLIPQKAPAATGTFPGTMLMASGHDYRRDSTYGACVFLAGSGGGAIWGYDGWPLMFGTGAQGSFHMEGVELHEFQYPHLVLEFNVNTDSAGAGRWRGGPGAKIRLKGIKHSMEVLGYGDGHRHKPFGFNGGKPGSGGFHYVIDKTGEKTIYPAGGKFILKEDETYVGFSTGGGGVGNPLERDIELVREDVIEKIISLFSAKEDYGVVINEQTLEVDYEATKTFREKLLGKRCS